MTFGHFYLNKSWCSFVCNLQGCKVLLEKYKIVPGGRIRSPCWLSSWGPRCCSNQSRLLVLPTSIQLLILFLSADRPSRSLSPRAFWPILPGQSQIPTMRCKLPPPWNPYNTVSLFKSRSTSSYKYLSISFILPTRLSPPDTCFVKYSHTNISYERSRGLRPRVKVLNRPDFSLKMGCAP